MWLSPKREEMPQFANDYIFIWLTNNTYMDKQADAIEHPLEQPFHKEFLRKREEIRITAAEIELIFKGEAALAYSNFLRNYEAALAVMYEYQIIIEDNGRSALLAHPDHIKTLNCIRCGACMNTCPVYRRSGGYSYTYFIPGPIGINLGMAHDPEKYYDNLSACKA